MLRRLRRKIASSISVIQDGEDFLHNSWLRVPSHDSVSIGKISSRILDTSHITFSIEKPFFTGHFFKLGKTTLYPEDLNYLFGKVGTNPVFFQLLYVPSKVIYHPDIELKPLGYSARQIKFQMKKAANGDVGVKFNLQEPTSYLFRLDEPNIKDYLQNFKTKVEKIELLNIEDLLSEGNDTVIEEVNVKDQNIVTREIDLRNFGKLKLKKIKIDKVRKIPKLYKIKVPGMGKYRTTISTFKLPALKIAAVLNSPLLNFTLPSVSSAVLDFSSTKTVKYYAGDVKKVFHEPGVMVDELNESKNVSGILKLILKTTHKVEWGKRRDPDIFLNKFENENARFLAENDRAFLAEEPGLNKIKESFAALKFLFQNRIINSTLIVLPAGFLGHSESDKQLGVSLGWIGNLEKYCSDMSYSVISGDDDERLDAWNKSALIHIVDHKTFLNDHNSNILEEQRLANFDCVIIDEVQELLNNSDKSKSVLKEINSNIFWTLSSIVGDDILGMLNEYLNENCRIKERKVRFLTDVEEEYAVINHEEFWLEPDEHQRIEYKETLVECRKELKRVLESGNPFRYQSNIFILIHKLFQVQNYAHGYDTSPKSDLLIQHIKAIERNVKKVIVISQYDRQGTKKIERLLDQHKISYITVPTSLSGDEMKKAVSLFKSRKSITVFLTNAKISRLNFRDFVVPYIIRFDSWWNPALLWQTKNLFNLSESNNGKNILSVFTYKMLDTIDELIKRICISKNLIDDNIISVMPPSTVNDLISIDEWLKVFDMPVNDEQENLQKLYKETVEKLSNLSLADYRATLSRFFFTIGYTNIEILEHENSASFDMTGEGKSGNQTVYLSCRVLLDEIITKDTIKQIIFDASLANKNNTFIITRGKIEKGSNTLAAKNVTLLDTEKLAMYLVNLRLVKVPDTQFS
ncbi:MAG: hypothetical protein BMS9Abin39_0652 [Ignavibacteria bacterium]|nr:MAG: hypothetical protein BMS9Abin39_0652 [Ignavibacteria bacterium]